MFEFLRSNTGKVINVNDIDGILGKIELIDIREPYEYNAGSIKGAKNIPMGILLKEPERFMDKEHTYYLVCQSGGRSQAAVKALSKLGYQVVNVAGGCGSYAGSKKA